MTEISGKSLHEIYKEYARKNKESIVKVECQTCGKDFEVNHDFFSMLYPFCSIECWDNYTKYEGSDDE